MRKIAVVTGSTRGIGAGIAKRLERDGYIVVYSGARDAFDAAHYVQCDISCAEDRQRLLDYAKDTFGRCNVLVNNAGVAPEVRADILEASEDSYDRVMNINCKGTYFMCQLFGKYMAEQRSGVIVNVSSVSAYTASVMRGEYCVSKAGISMATQLFAARLAEYGVYVHEVRPGIIETDMTAAVQEKYQRMIDDGLTPIRRMGTPDDVAAAVSALVCGGMTFATGQVIDADGGFHIRRL